MHFFETPEHICNIPLDISRTKRQKEKEEGHPEAVGPRRCAEGEDRNLAADTVV